MAAALIKYSYLREADGSVTRNEDGTLTIKKYVVEEFAQAMFAADPSVPEIPASLSDTAIRYENESNRTFQFILNDNGYKDELPDPLFYYTISNVSPMDDSFSDLTQETEENSPGQEPSTQNVSE